MARGDGRDAPLARTVIVIGDLIEWHGDAPGWVTEPEPGTPDLADAAALRANLVVEGGYLERLALAWVKAGHADRVEVWHHLAPHLPHRYRVEHPLLLRRAFPMNERGPPVASAAMARHLARFGAPALLLVLGLGVDAAVLEAAEGAIRIYNSIDAPALRIPDAVARHCDLVLTGAPWQSAEVERRVPGLPTAVLPIGPDFAAPEQFRPVGTAKRFDAIYVAAAQPYKRHDILFDAIAAAEGRLSALCVVPHGELADHLRRRAADEQLPIEIVGPPGVPYPEVNRLMNLARVGVVCGVDDGAPAILTEYMLAGLPVLANDRLTCGLQYVLPETGVAAPAERFGEALAALAARADRMDPRSAVLERWTWPHSIARLERIVAAMLQVKGIAR